MNEAPSGYSSTEQAIRTALAPLGIDALEVEVLNACIYLHGSVGCYDKKRQAAELAAAASGLEVLNELRVAHAGGGDGDALAAVRAALSRAGEDVLADVRVDFSGGCCELHGAVRTQHQRQILADLAWSVDAVTAVNNHLAVHGDDAYDEAISRALTEYVERALALPPGVVQVRYDAGTATITGTVASATYSAALEDLVRWHDGVEDVANELRVAGALDQRRARPRT